MDRARPSERDHRVAFPHNNGVVLPDLDLDRVRQAIESIRFGEVRLVIQDGVIVQIERLEKQRLR